MPVCMTLPLRLPTSLRVLRFNYIRRYIMASSSVISKLPSPLRDLVASAAPKDEDFGTSDKDKAEVSDWISKVAQGDIVKPEAAKVCLIHCINCLGLLIYPLGTRIDVNAENVSREQLPYSCRCCSVRSPTPYPRESNIRRCSFRFILIFSSQSQLQPPQYYSHPALTRYFDHIQTRPSVRKAADALSPSFPLVSFDLDNMPKLDRKADPPKKKEKAAKASPPEAVESKEKSVKQPKQPKEAVAKEGGEAQKKEKKEKAPKEKGAAGDAASGKKAAGGGKNAPAEDAGEPVPSMIDLRVGHIVDSMCFLAICVLNTYDHLKS